MEDGEDGTEKERLVEMLPSQVAELEQSRGHSLLLPWQPGLTERREIVLRTRHPGFAQAVPEEPPKWTRLFQTRTEFFLNKRFWCRAHLPRTADHYPEESHSQAW